MKRKIFIAGIILFILGLSFGALLGIHGLEASSPEPPEVSGGEETPSVLWHEHWLATQGYVSSSGGYEEVTLYDTATDSWSSLTEISGRMVGGTPTQVEINPDMMVSRWRVRGHIHFR